MNRIFRLTPAILTASMAWQFAAAQALPPLTADLEWRGRIVVEFAENLGIIRVHHVDGTALVGNDKLDALARQFGVYEIQQAIPGIQKPENAEIRDLSRFYIVEFPQRIDLHEVARAYAENSDVVTAEPYYVRRCDYTPNDPMFPQQWALDITDAETAFDYCQGSDSVIIGLVDSGIDTAHEDLRENLWINPGEDLNGNGVIEPAEWNGVDDDLNGHIDDFWGWNVWQNTNNVQDVPGGHGTACAGCASAVTDNGVGISSLGWKAKIMMAKAGDGMFIYASAAGINYLAMNGAKVLSLSYGGSFYSAWEAATIANAWQQGCIIVASAGGGGAQNPQYPAAYEHVEGVAATDANDHLASFSNYGRWIDVCAPGVGILTATPGNVYAIWDGTSFGNPIMGGLACLVWAARPDFTNEEVLRQIYSTCVNIDSLNPGYEGLLGHGRIDAGAAISGLFTLHISLTPSGAPIIIPNYGGNFSYNIAASNDGTTSRMFEVWCDVTMPNGSSFGPVLGPISLTLAAGGNIARDRTQYVPGNAPAGQYSYNAYLGAYPGLILSQDEFNFTKLGSRIRYNQFRSESAGSSGWTNTGDPFEIELAAKPIPNDFALDKPHPNPFNPTTAISFTLPSPGRVELQIYDIAGRLTATLMDGWCEAGHHDVRLDGSGFASGVYIICLQAGERQAFQKMVMMK